MSRPDPEPFGPASTGTQPATAPPAVSGPKRASLDLALRVTVGLVVLAFGVLLVDLVRQRSWLDVALLLIGGALLTVCYLLQRWSRPNTG
jgi:hypothetical protein